MKNEKTRGRFLRLETIERPLFTLIYIIIKYTNVLKV